MRMLRVGSVLVVILPLLMGCQPRRPQVSDRGREICLQEAAAQSGTASEAGRKFSECMKTVDQRLDQQIAQQLADERADAAAAEARKPEKVSAERRYFFCLANRAAIKNAADGLASATTAWKYYSTRRPPDDPDLQQAKARYEEAYAVFEETIPPEMRGGLPLIPDAARVFRNCRRENFID